MTSTFSPAETWNSAACLAVKEMVERGGTAQSLEALRTFYDEMAKRSAEPDIDAAVIAAMWSEFGARVHQSAALLSGQSLLWGVVIDTVIAKQRDYGKENITRFGQFGLIVRVHDKLARLEHLAATAADPRNESRADTVLDLVGYSVLGILLAREHFDLPLI
jgi:hypothetical protein